MGLQPLHFSYFSACVKRSWMWPPQSSERGPVLYANRCKPGWSMRIWNILFLSLAPTTSTAGSPPERGGLARDKRISFEPGTHGFSFLLCYRFSLWTSESNLHSLWFSVRCKIVAIAWPFISNAHKRKWIKEMWSVSHYYVESPRERNIEPKEMN